MNGRDIDYKILIENIDEMITLMEFDSMRSAGKCRLNAPTIESLYNLKDRYGAMVQDDKSTRKKTKAVAEA